MTMPAFSPRRDPPGEDLSVQLAAEQLLEQVLRETETLGSCGEPRRGSATIDLEPFRAYVRSHRDISPDEGLTALVRLATPRWVRAWVQDEQAWQAFTAEIACWLRANPRTEQRLRAIWTRLGEE